MIYAVLVGGDKALKHLAMRGDRMREALLREMRRQWFALQAYIVTYKLSGQVLNRVTGVLASSINAGGSMTATAFEEGALEIVGRVGTRVWYGKVHEEGGTFHVKAHDRTASQVFGRPVTPFVQHVRDYDVTFPERSFLRSGLADRSEQFRMAMVQAARQGFKS